MIGDLFFGVIAFVLRVITYPLTFLDDVSESSDIANGFLKMAEYYTSVNDFVPILVIISIIAFDVLYENSVLFYKGVRWIYQKIPFIH